MRGLNFQELISAFIVLFAVIDIIGAVPIILDLKQKGRAVNAWQATLIATALLVGFFFAGDMMLKLFQVDIASFAVAGAFVIFLMSLEMKSLRIRDRLRRLLSCLWFSRSWLEPVRSPRCCPCVPSMLPLTF